MIIFAVMKKILKEFYRNRISFVLLIIFPLFFLFIFKLAFGVSEIGGVTTYNIAIVNNDQGIPEPLRSTLPPEIAQWNETGVGNNISQIILDMTYNDSERTPIFNHVNISGTSLRDAVLDGTISTAVIIPENYSLMVLNQINNIYGNQSIPGYPVNINATIEFLVDENNAEAEIPISIIKQVVNSFHQAINSGRLPHIAEINSNSVLRGEVNSIFDFIASGILVFASIVAASLFSALLLADQEQDTIRRIKLSIISPTEYILGFFFITFLLIMIQNAILIYSAVYIFGFDPIGSLFRGYIILLLSSLPMFALIFTAGSLFNTSDAAGNVIGFSSSILGFASNAFFEMPNIVLIPDILSFTSGSPDFLLWDIVPWTHAVNAMRTILLFDRSLSDVGGDIILLIITSLIWLVISIRLFTKKTFALED